jgi:hypothetical protein
MALSANGMMVRLTILGLLLGLLPTSSPAADVVE